MKKTNKNCIPSRYNNCPLASDCFDIVNDSEDCKCRLSDYNKAINDYFEKIEIVAFGSRNGLVHFKDIVLLREQLKGE